MNNLARTTPLDDIILNNTETVPWGFLAADGLIKFYSYFLMVITCLHRDRLMIISRFFFIMGVLFLYRAILMPVTNLPVPNLTKNCSQVLIENYTEIENAGSTSEIIPGFWLLLNGAIEVGKTMGMDIRYCGDYMYSGHTLCLICLSQFIYLYLPGIMGVIANSGIYKFFRVLSWILVHAALVLILLAKEHYTIDVLVAYFFSSATIYVYHNEVLRKSHENRVVTSSSTKTSLSTNFSQITKKSEKQQEKQEQRINFAMCETKPWFLFMIILNWIENVPCSKNREKFEFPILFSQKQVAKYTKASSSLIDLERVTN